MTKEVFVHVKGLQFFGDEPETEDDAIELMTTGVYYLKNGHHYIRYEEMFEGFEEAAKNVVKITDDVIEVRKKGVISSHMVFEKNKKNITYYTTPFGTMQMEIFATEVFHQEKEDEISIKIAYGLEMNDGPVGDCRLEMSIRSKEQ